MTKLLSNFRFGFNPLVAALLAFTPRAVFGGTETAHPNANNVSSLDGARLWAQSCSRCHNVRPAETYSGTQWAVIVHHMRVRAQLTGPEARAIVAFLQDSK